MYDVRVSADAASDLVELARFVAATSGARRAEHLRDMTFAAVATLKDDPLRGAPRSPKHAGVRFILTRLGTQIVYRVREAERVVDVIAIAHRGRDIAALLRMRP